MEEIKKNTYYKWGIITIIVLFSIFILYLNHLVPYLPGDDHIFQCKLPAEGILGKESIDSFTSFFESQLNLYNNYHYRLINHAVLQFLLLLPSWFFDFLNTIVFLLFPYAILNAQKYSRGQEYWKRYLALLLFVWIFHFDLGRCYFLTTGSLNYSWLLLPQLLYVAQLFKLEHGDQNFKTLLFLALLNFNSNENVQVVLFLLTLFFAFKYRYKILWVCSFILLLGGLFMLASPSIDGRIVEQGFRDDSILNHSLEYFKRSIYYYLSYLPVLLFALFSVGKKHWSSLKSKLLIATIFIANGIMIFIPLFEPRSAIFGFCLALVWVMQLTDSLKLKNSFVVSLVAIATILFILRTPSFIDLHQRHQANEKLLENHKGAEELMLNNYCDKTKRSYLLCHEISTDPNYIDNQTLSNFYKIESVGLNSQVDKSFAAYKDRILGQVISNGDENIELTNGISVQINYEGKNAAFVLIDNNKEHKKYIIRGALKSLGTHSLYKLLPKEIQLYFLDYLESDILGEGYLIDNLEAEFSYHYISDYSKYQYFLISEYSMSAHAPIGEVHYIDLNDK